MSDYVKATDFASKDALLSGNPAKVIKGTEIDSEFNAIAVAVSTKADLASPTFTGTPLAPTASAATNTTQIATTAFVGTAITNERTASATLTNKTLTSPVITGANAAITSGSITGITDLAVADGGTGASSITANSVILGNGTSALNGNLVAPGSSGNVLTSNGTTWTSSAAAYLKAINRVSVLSSTSTGTLTSSVSSSTFGGITPSYVMYFVSAYYAGTVADLREYIVCFGNSLNTDNVLLGHTDDTDQSPTSKFADSTMIILPYAASQEFHVTFSGGGLMSVPTLKVWAIGYQV